MKVGETVSITKVFTETDIASFAEITGDNGCICRDWYLDSVCTETVCS